MLIVLGQDDSQTFITHLKMEKYRFFSHFFINRLFENPDNFFFRDITRNEDHYSNETRNKHILPSIINFTISQKHVRNSVQLRSLNCKTEHLLSLSTMIGCANSSKILRSDDFPEFDRKDQNVNKRISNLQKVKVEENGRVK